MKEERTLTVLKNFLEQLKTEIRVEMTKEIGDLVGKKMEDFEKKMMTKEDFEKKMEDFEKKMEDFEKKMKDLNVKMENIQSHLQILQLKEDTGLSMLLSPGQQASIGVSGFDID